jgi:hypothetical protein
MQHVRILSWHLLYGRSMPLVGKEGWQRLEAHVEVPDFRNMDPGAPCAMGPFIAALRFMAREAAQGADFIQTLAHNSVQGWASQNGPLVRELQGKPQAMLEMFLTQVYPWFVDDPAACRIITSSPDHAVITLDTDMIRDFEIGLIEGYLQLAGATPQVTELEPKRYHVTWKTGAS